MNKVKADVIDSFVIEFNCPECCSSSSDIQAQPEGSMTYICDECEHEFEVEWE